MDSENAPTTIVPVFDGHNDSLTSDHHAQLAQGSADGHLDLPRMRAGGVRAGIFAVFVDSSEPHTDIAPQAPTATGAHVRPLAARVTHSRAAALATRYAGRLLALERAGHLRVARTTADLDAAAGDPEGPPAAVLHLEGAEPVHPSLQDLDLWYAAGLRSLGPVWSRPNAFGHGVPFAFPSSPDTGPALTPAGRRLARRCAELGIAFDLSHLNEAGFWSVAKLDLGPLIVSHSGAHALSACSRNLTDAQLDAVGSSGGLVGVVFSCYFLRADFANEPDTTPLELIVDHVRHIAERIGVEHVAFGSDFDGTTVPTALGDVAGYPRLLTALARAGMQPAEIRMIAWDNWRRVLGSCWREP